MRIPESELILNPDGSVYHLDLLPTDISTTVITVGDPERVKVVSSFFDSIEIEKGKREFLTHTGMYKGKRITVLSTGIGTDNIDIVFNELDALVNIDFDQRMVKEDHTALDIIRIGTSGCLDETMPIDGVLLSTAGLGLDGLMNYYSGETSSSELDKYEFFSTLGLQPYYVTGSEKLLRKCIDDTMFTGITATCTGFYGPQGRQLRLKPKLNILDELESVSVDQQRVTNFEMETAGIYGLSKLLGHHALSVNLLIANRKRGEFSTNPKQKMKELIERMLDKIVSA